MEDSKKTSILSSLSLTKSEIVNDKNIDFIFSDTIILRGKKFNINKAHTIFELSRDEMRILLKMWGMVNKKDTIRENIINTLSENDYNKISHEYRLFNELMESEKLGFPQYVLYKQLFPLIAVYENVSYAISPTIESYEDDSVMKEYPLDENHTYPIEDYDA